MHSTSEGEPILEPRPREREVHLLTPVTRRVSGDGAPPRATPVRTREHATERTGRVERLLRHRLTSPEKRTVKRVQAQRLDWFAVGAPGRSSRDLVSQRVLEMLREDRGLQRGLDGGAAWDQLTDWLLDEALAGRTAAEIIGLYLRETGAMERPELSAPRVKNALRVLNEVLYGDLQAGPIPQGVREFRLEKRDGGLQIVGLLRAGADEVEVGAACRATLAAAEHEDVDVRLVSRP